MRELALMAEGRQKTLWALGASVMALLANLHRDPKKGRKWAPRDFNPFEPCPKQKAPLTVLRDVFVKEKG